MVKTDKIEGGTKMIRMDLIYSAAIEEDLFEGFKERDIGKKYTKLNNVMGVGCSLPRLGDAIWPQLNVQLIIFCNENEAKEIVEVVEVVRKLYPTEGVACFQSEAIVW